MRSPRPFLIIPSFMATLSLSALNVYAIEPNIEGNAATLSYCSSFHRELTGRRRSVFEESVENVQLRFTNAAALSNGAAETAAEMATVAGLDAETVGLNGGLWGGALIQAVGELCGVSGWKPDNS
ncbi:MAG: hypothetical protein QNJ46_24490 [Leptolyngbyaceae cyanobacterium MO_188.B28]|nr:hypothetical protein [Leptolyngbyaceae cyanobacterium MO_188.B28]